jgi:hypothetical protein
MLVVTAFLDFQVRMPGDGGVAHAGARVPAKLSRLALIERRNRTHDSPQRSYNVAQCYNYVFIRMTGRQGETLEAATFARCCGPTVAVLLAALGHRNLQCRAGATCP